MYRSLISRTSAVLLFVAVAATPAAAFAQAAGAQQATIVTSDIPRFWRAIDRAAGGDSAALVNALRTEYFEPASPGLRSFVAVRIASQQSAMAALKAAGWDMDRARRAMSSGPGTQERAALDSITWPALAQSAAVNLARTYTARKAYYDGIRANTLSLAENRAVTDSIRASFARMKALYPETRFADVYFLIGRMTSGGTTSGNQLLIGTEINGRDPSTPIGELNAWEKSVTGQIADLPQMVAHEFVHTLQADHNGTQTLLRSALIEGSADFIAELIAGKHIINPAYAYGDAHEAALWSEFRASMDSTKTDAWLYNGVRSTDRPADLGYWMGYRIAKAYYDRATDKRAAIRDILALRDEHSFLKESGYGGTQ